MTKMKVPHIIYTSTEPAEYHSEKSCFPPSFRNVTDLSADTNILAKRLNGRLGNQMFQLASTYALARDNSMTPMVLDYNKLFACFSDINVALSLYGRPERDWPHQSEYGVMMYNKQMNDMSKKNSSILLTAYMQSWKYFHHRENEVRCQFMFQNIVQRNVNTFLHAVARRWHIMIANKSKGNSSVDTVIPPTVPISSVSMFVVAISCRSIWPNEVIQFQNERILHVQ